MTVEKELADALSAMRTWRACAEARAREIEALQKAHEHFEVWKVWRVEHFGDAVPEGMEFVQVPAADYTLYRALHETMKARLASAINVMGESPEITAALAALPPDAEDTAFDALAFPARALRPGDGIPR